MFESLLKAVVGVVIETPLAVATDIVTIGGALTDKNEPYTVTASSTLSITFFNALTV